MADEEFEVALKGADVRNATTVEDLYLPVDPLDNQIEQLLRIRLSSFSQFIYDGFRSTDNVIAVVEKLVHDLLSYFFNIRHVSSSPFLRSFASLRMTPCHSEGLSPKNL